MVKVMCNSIKTVNLENGRKWKDRTNQLYIYIKGR